MLKLHKSAKIFFLLFLLLSFPFCKPRRQVQVTPQQLAEYNLQLKKADSFYHQGCYLCLKKAFQIYQSLLSFPRFQIKIKEKLLKTSLLLVLRQNEMSTLENKYQETASSLIQNNPNLAEFLPYLKIAYILSRQRIRFMTIYLEKESEIENYYTWLEKNVEALKTKLKEKSEAEEFYAYFYISFKIEYSSFFKEKESISQLGEIFSNSPLIQYKLATASKVDKKKLTALIEKEPKFYEAYYFLGELDLALGKIISAEKKFLIAHQHFPHSISTIMSLTKIYFAFEEFEKCLKFNEKALQLVPSYRETLLGKAISLSYLGRYDQAIKCLDRLLAQGTYLMGETNYWLAWNENELGQFQKAWEDIESAKKYLIGHHEVHSLAGIIAFQLGKMAEAEKDLNKAINLNPDDGQALLYMGKIKSQQNSWKKAGFYFDKAAACFENNEKAISQKIKGIENSSLSEERKKKLLLRKKSQLATTFLTQSTCYYNAAASYFNSGIKDKALSLARKAAMHRAFHQKAEELISKIKGQKEKKK